MQLTRTSIIYNLYDQTSLLSNLFLVKFTPENIFVTYHSLKYSIPLQNLSSYSIYKSKIDFHVKNMNYKSSEQEYGLVAVSIHWISALLIFALIPIGSIMADMPNSDLKTLLYRIHILIGLTVLLLTLIRIVWAFLDTRPKAVEMTKENFYLYKAIQILMYVVLTLLTLSGLVLLMTSGLIDVLLGTTTTLPFVHRTPPALVHNILSKILIALLLVHIAGVVYHQYAKSDILARMGVKIKLFENFYNNR